jgi:hypothetical protein
MNKYSATHQSPYHLSVGVILMTNDGKIVCHKVNHGNIKDGYTIARRTIKDNETLEEAVSRGIMEEFGATGDVVGFLGSKTTTDEWWHEINDPKDVEKTTLFFLVNQTSRDESLRKEEEKSLEGLSEIVEVEPEFLIEQMPKQAKEVGWSDLDESEMIKRAIKQL